MRPLLPLLLVLSIPMASGAQDLNAPPSVGSVEIEAGFVPDPHEVAVVAGGPNDASEVGCTGFISAAANFELIYTSDAIWPLNLYVVSDADTTLIVYRPNGTWACADDTEGFNPGLTFDFPRSGIYRIWVGSSSADESPEAMLKISEVEPQW